MALEYQQKAKDLFHLYKEEKKHEERTRRMLDELEKNAQQMQIFKMKLIEKLLDVQVKDELSRQATSEPLPVGQVSSDLIRANARRKIENEVKANIDESRAMYTDGFVAQLDKMVHMPDDAARRDVHGMVEQYVDPHIEMLRRQKRKQQPPTALQSVAVAAARVKAEKRRELAEHAEFRARQDASDRLQRVAAAQSMFKKDIGDLTSLLRCVPKEYKTEIGKKEAEINDLRRTIAKQRAIEERLLQERQIQLSLIETDQAKLSAEVEAVCQRQILMERELETKELDLREMAESQAPGSGSWATNTMQLERDLSLALEEEFHLRHENDEVRKTNEILSTEKAALDAEIADSIEELGTAQQEYQSVLTKLEERLAGEKARLYSMRDAELEITRKINELRYRILHRREDVRRQKRDLRAVVNTTISQLSIEDRLQSRLMARSLELQKNAEKARAQADYHMASLSNQLAKVNAELQAKSTQISSFAEQLTNYYAGDEKKLKESKNALLVQNMTAQQLQVQIDQLLKEWARIEWEAASSVAQVASRVDLNQRENEKVLKAMGSLAVMQDDLLSEGVDIAATSTDELERIRDAMYAEATQRSYREAKYTQMVRMLRERLQLRGRGERIEPLSRNRRVPLEQRRARREALDRSKAARQIALEHLRTHMSGGTGNRALDATATSPVPRSASMASTAMGGAGGSSVAPSPGGHTPEFRMVVINFIKKEIQPLYDTNQITKRRFIDIVARVSSWFLETHRPAHELTEQNVGELVRKIQDVITWQDEERLKQQTPR